MSRNIILLSVTVLLSVGTPLLAAETIQVPPSRNSSLEEGINQAYPDREQIEARRKQIRDRMRKKLQRADQNGDGSISRAEAERDLPGVARHFDQIDTDHDGVLSRAELHTAREKRRELREHRMKKNQ